MKKTVVKSVALIMGTFAFGGVLSATTINVPVDQPTIAAAIAASSSGDTINVAAGTYTESSLTISKNLIIQGAGAESTIVQASATRGVAGARVFNITLGTVLLQGMTIRHGQIAASNGAGIRVLGGVPVIDSCSIVDNDYTGSGAGGGGGVAVDAGATTLSITNSTISGNTSGWQGGGIRFNGTTLTMVNSTVASNVALRPAKCGGGIYFGGTAGVSSISNCTFAGNSAPGAGGEGGRGGGFYMVGGTVDLVSTIIAGNSANMPDWDDFAYFAGTVTDSYCLVGKNDSANPAIIEAGTPNASNSYVGSNVAPISGKINSLADNGGQTKTCRLQADSLAIDHGSNPQSLGTDQRGNGYVRTFGAQTDIGALESQPAPRWDFNADGKSDVLAFDGTSKWGWLYLMNGATPSASNDIYQMRSLDWNIVAIADFNGDRKSDLMWQNSSTSQILIYLMNGFTVMKTGTILAGSSNAWTVKGVGDFNDDGKADVLIEDGIYRQGYIILVDGTSVLSGGWVQKGSDWSVKNVSDFNGDGKADILWEIDNRIGNLYLMNGLTVASEGQIYTRSSTWDIVGYADFNGDAKTDLLWETTDQRTGYMFLMNGLSIESQGYVYNKTELTWCVIQMDDFNADMKADLLWTNTRTGVSMIWLMDGLSMTSSGSPYVNTSPFWEIKRLLDFNGDGKADILWERNDTNKTIDYLIDGTSVLSTGTVFGNGTKSVVGPLFTP